MASPQIALNNYLDLMEEIKVRIRIINFTALNVSGFPSLMVREICYLQFRLICEMIALGCLVARGSMQGVDALRETYQADKIIKQMGRAHTAFYPEPGNITRNPKNPLLLTFEGKAATADYLTKERLKELWRKTADVLHRGSYTKLHAPNIVQPDMSDVYTWSSRITTLLSDHLIAITNTDNAFIVSLNGWNQRATGLSCDMAGAMRQNPDAKAP
jgi:hypothetical protein